MTHQTGVSGEANQQKSEAIAITRPAISYDRKRLAENGHSDRREQEDHRDRIDHTDRRQLQVTASRNTQPNAVEA